MQKNKQTKRRNSLVASGYSLVAGFTIMELVVASSLFMIVASIATGTFVQSLRNQRDIKDLTAANSNAAQAIETMAREIRTGTDFSETNENELKFINYRAEKVVYRLLGDKTIGKCIVTQSVSCSTGDDSVFTSITSKKYPITLFKIYTPIDTPPSRITLSLTIQGIKGQLTTIQTTVSSKNI